MSIAFVAGTNNAASNGYEWPARRCLNIIEQLVESARSLALQPESEHAD